MDRPDNNYRLVIFDAPDDPEAMRDLLRGVTGIHPTDANRWVARTPGIWPRPLAEGEVRELLDGLYDLGVAAEAWRADLLPNLSPPRAVHDVAGLPEGFRVTGLRGEPTHWVPWDKIELIAASQVEQPDELRAIKPPSWVQAVRTGLNAMLNRPQRLARRERSMRIPRDPVGHVLLVRKAPRLAFLAAENTLSFAYLGDRLQSAASANFPLFLADLATLATDAFITPSTRALIGPDPDAQADLFPSVQALLDDATVRLLWSWYRRDRDSRSRRPGGPPGSD
jgi:hypothetical protein